MKDILIQIWEWCPFIIAGLTALGGKIIISLAADFLKHHIKRLWERWITRKKRRKKRIPKPIKKKVKASKGRKITSLHGIRRAS